MITVSRDQVGSRSNLFLIIVVIIRTKRYPTTVNETNIMNTAQLKVIPNTTEWQHELSLVMVKVVLVIVMIAVAVLVVVVLEVATVVARALVYTGAVTDTFAEVVTVAMRVDMLIIVSHVVIECHNTWHAD